MVNNCVALVCKSGSNSCQVVRLMATIGKALFVKVNELQKPPDCTQVSIRRGRGCPFAGFRQEVGHCWMKEARDGLVGMAGTDSLNLQR